MTPIHFIFILKTVLMLYCNIIIYPKLYSKMKIWALTNKKLANVPQSTWLVLSVIISLEMIICRLFVSTLNCEVDYLIT